MANLEGQILDHVGQRLDRYDIVESAKAGTRNVVLAEESAPDDGWITKVGVQAGGNARNVTSELIVLGADGELRYKSGVQTWNSVVQRRESEIPEAQEIIAEANQRFRIGFWANPNAAVQYAGVDRPGQHFTAIESGSPKPRPNVNQQGRPTGAWMGFVRNRKPNPGTFPDWGDEERVRNDMNPLFEARMPHHPAEGGRDFTKFIHFQIRDVAADALVFDVTEDATPQEQKRGEFSRRLHQHEGGKQYQFRFRYADRFARWSDWSNWKNYRILEGPNPGEIAEPVDGQTVYTQTPTFRGLYSHPKGTAAKQMRYQLWTDDRKLLVADSGWTAISGSSWSRNALAGLGIASLKKGGRYAWRYRNRDVNDVEGEWSEWATFKVNSPPYVPSRLVPSENAVHPSGILSCRILDEDKDDIREVRFLVTRLDGTPLTGYPKVVLGPFKNGSTVSFSAKADLVNGTEYLWQAWATDGTFQSDRSAAARFRFEIVPEVSVLAPQQDALTNMVKNASFEYGVSHHTLRNTDPSLTLGLVEGVEASHGFSSVEARREVSGGTGGEVQTEAFDVDVSRPAIYHATFKVFDEFEENTIRSRCFLRCFDAAGNNVGDLYRSGAEGGLLDGTKAPAWYWEQYGGFVAASGWPSGAVKASVVAVPLDAGAGVVRVDDMFYASTIGTRGAEWFGFFDGADRGFNVTDDYTWTGEEGSSSSSGIPVLSEPLANVEISYFSEVNSPKRFDQLVIEEYNAERKMWNLVHLGGLLETARTSIPLPPGVVKNQRSYRLFVGVQDTAGKSSRTSFARFDTDFEGPPEPTILEATADSGRARIALSWLPTTLDQNVFGGYEVAIESIEEGEKRLATINDAQTTSYFYDFPASNRAYKVKIRQIELAPNGEELQSRWSVAEVSVDFFGKYFLKSIGNPDLYVAFEPLRGEIPGSQTQAIVDEFLPLHSTLPSHNFSPARWGSGSFSATLWDDPELTVSGYEARALIRQAEMVDRRMVILSHLPSDKHFIAVIGMEYLTNEYLEPVINVEWTETYYEEDWTLREGTQSVNTRNLTLGMED